VVPRTWTHLLATVLDREVDPNTPLPADWVAHTATVARGVRLPTSMSDGSTPEWSAWDGSGEDGVDRAILETRRAVYPLFGLDPEDPRD
jgi:acetoin utilization protein AcuC